jgi:hypothetical protein
VILRKGELSGAAFRFQAFFDKPSLVAVVRVVVLKVVFEVVVALAVFG